MAPANRKAPTLSEVSADITAAFSGLKTLVNDVNASKDIADRVNGAFDRGESNLEAIISVFAQLVDGTLTNTLDEASILMGNNLMDLLNGLSFISQDISFAISIGGDGVAPVVTAAFYSFIEIHRTVLTVVHNVFKVIDGSFDVDYVDTLEHPTRYMAVSVQTEIDSINTAIGYIVGGEPTGPLTPVDGLASALRRPFENASYFFFMLSTSFVGTAISNSRFALNLSNTLYDTLNSLQEYFYMEPTETL